MAPAVAELELKNEDKVRFVGISGQDDPEEMAGFVEEYGLAGFDHVADLHGQIWRVFGVNAQPSYVFINDDGTLTRHVGGLDPDEVQEQIDRLVES